MAATFAGMPTLSRRKSTLRYCFLWPPPRCQTTISPWLFRPPERFFGSSSAFSGSCLVMWLLSTTVMNRRDAVYGLKLFSPIAASYLLTANSFCTTWVPVLQVFRVLDHLLAFGELHVRLLPIAPVADVLSAAAHLADEIRGADVRDLYLENLLHSLFDFRLGGGGGNFKHHRVLQLFYAKALFRDDGPANDLIVRGCHGLFLPLFLGRLCRCFGRRLLGRRFRRSFFLCCFRSRSDCFHVRSDDRLLLRIERVAQTRHCIFRENDQVMLQNVVGL